MASSYSDQQQFSDASCSESSDNEGEKFGDIGQKLKGGGGSGGGLFGSDDECSEDENLFQGAPPPACPPPARQCKPVRRVEPLCPPKPCGSELQQQQPVPIGAAVPAAVDAAAAPKKSVKAAPKETEKNVVNTYLIQKQVSFNELAANPDAAKWTVNEAAHWIYKKEKVANELRNKNYKEKRLGNPEKSVIQKVTVKSIRCDAPRSIKVKIPHIRVNSYDANGDDYAFVMRAGENMRGEMVIYNCTTALDSKLMKKYGHITKESLEKAFVPNLDENLFNVRVDSPIVEIMSMDINPVLKNVLDKSLVIQDGISQVVLPRTTVNKVCSQILDMLQRLPHVNMKEFGVQLVRADTEKWSDETNIITFSGSPEEIAAELDRKFDIEIELEVEHVLTTIQ